MQKKSFEIIAFAILGILVLIFLTQWLITEKQIHFNAAITFLIVFLMIFYDYKLKELKQEIQEELECKRKY